MTRRLEKIDRETAAAPLDYLQAQLYRDSINKSYGRQRNLKVRILPTGMLRQCHSGRANLLNRRGPVVMLVSVIRKARNGRLFQRRPGFKAWAIAAACISLLIGSAHGLLAVMAGEHSFSLTLLHGHWHIVLGHGAQNEVPVVMPVPESSVDASSMWEPHDNHEFFVGDHQPIPARSRGLDVCGVGGLSCSRLADAGQCERLDSYHRGRPPGAPDQTIAQIRSVVLLI